MTGCGSSAAAALHRRPPLRRSKSQTRPGVLREILREADGASVAEVAKKHGVSEQTLYVWKKRFGKMEALEVRRLRQADRAFVRHEAASNQLVQIPSG